MVYSSGGSGCQDREERRPLPQPGIVETPEEPMVCRRICQEEATQLLGGCDGIEGQYLPLGLFYLQEGEKTIGIDNSTGRAWVEEFPDEESCLRWLKGEEAE